MPAAMAGGGTIGVPPSDEASGPASGTGAVQLGGTDNPPIIGACPRPADTASPTPPTAGPATSPAGRAPLAQQAQEWSHCVTGHVEPGREGGVPDIGVGSPLRPKVGERGRSRPRPGQQPHDL